MTKIISIYCKHKFCLKYIDGKKKIRNIASVFSPNYPKLEQDFKFQQKCRFFFFYPSRILENRFSHNLRWARLMSLFWVSEWQLLIKWFPTYVDPVFFFFCFFAEFWDLQTFFSSRFHSMVTLSHPQLADQIGMSNSPLYHPRNFYVLRLCN